MIETLPRRNGVLVPAAEGGRINIDNFRTREWVPAVNAAGLEQWIPTALLSLPGSSMGLGWLLPVLAVWVCAAVLDRCRSTPT